MQSPTATRPPLGLAFIELNRALMELATLPIAAPLLRKAARGDGHSVLVMPGFTASDRSTGILRRYLDDLGYDTHAWELGRNLGPRAIGHKGEKLIERLAAIHALSGKKVSFTQLEFDSAVAQAAKAAAQEAVKAMAKQDGRQ